MKAQYLLRFDDVCPTMNWRVWDQIEKTLCALDIKPILAVVPDNEDDVLRVCAPNPNFWDRVREWQSRGWNIAMHGWQHRFVTTDPGILNVQPFSEFAGLPRDEQDRKIRSGLSVFEKEGIQSELWIAPAHSFDAVTIELLAARGFRYLSDGFFLLPHVDRFGMTWIPQQLWSFRRRPFGVWTICFHVNRWTREELQAFQKNAVRFRETISTVGEIADRYAGREETILDSATASLYRAAAKGKSMMGELGRSSFRGNVSRAKQTNS
jgi:predicted deacetylase